jgi:hypothetical protein
MEKTFRRPFRGSQRALAPRPLSDGPPGLTLELRLSPALTRTSHQVSTAAAYPGMSCFVALPRAPRRTVEYACGALGRAPCIHARLRRLATKPGEKCGLVKFM